MPITDLFSKRSKRPPDVYTYDKLPEQLRVQVIHIWKSAIGPFFREDPWNHPASNTHWRDIHDTICREKGRFFLWKENYNAFAQCQGYLLESAVDDGLDIIEYSFRRIDSALRRQGRNANDECQVVQTPDSAIEELNGRLREHGVGYQFARGLLIRVDSEFVHAEVVRTSLQLLSDAHFKGAEQEFLTAHEHYRRGRNEEAIADALKSLESTLKTICDKKRWAYPQSATSKPLIDVVFKHGLIPTNLQSYFAGLRSTLESGLPTLRNSSGGHGQGSTPREVPDHVAAYALHLAAAAIVFLVESYRQLP